MTAAQNDALDRVKEILREHFEGSLLIVAGDVGDHREETRVLYHGGWLAAIGMIEEARVTLCVPRVVIEQDKEEE